MSNAPIFTTLGCRLNAYETEAMKELAQTAGVENVYVINTCAVTAEAVRKSKQEIRKQKRQFPEKQIIVTGCAAQIDPDSFAKMAEVSAVIGNTEKLSADTWRGLSNGFIGETERVQVDDIMSGRGNSRSVPAGVVVDQIKRLVDSGYNEVVLTGVDLTSWGADLPAAPKLGDLVMRILKLVPDLNRLRISSIDSIEVDENLMQAIATEPRLMPHLHLSLQHGDDLILKRMKRRHLRDDAIQFCEEARKLRPDMVFGADIIAGFPTETEAHFENSVKLVDECDLTWLHVFPYSARQGTPAARMPAVDGRLIKERAAILRQKGDEKVQTHLRDQVGKVHAVLMENPNMGRTEQFTEVCFDASQQESEIVTAQITDIVNGKLFAAPVTP
ncbi:MAG: radical SAM protein [Rhodobacteraceae bacterium]|nr:radical SAM protein [Paracoccaceae bacterium]